MKCSKSLRFLGLRTRPRWGAYDAPPDRSPNCEGPLSFSTHSLTYSRVLISTPASRSQVFPSRLTGLAQFCGADELWILLYSLYSPNLCFRAFCYFMNPASNKNLIHLLFSI